jgi:sulfoxide reductase heme-binding subunit YedZ
MTRHAAPANYVWWLAGRSAGMVALLLVAASVILGLAMAARAIPPRRRGEAVRLHQHLALLSLGAIAAHGLFLLADPWLKAGVKGIVVPFAIGYCPLWTGLGILGGYLAAILGLSFYMRRRIGARLWRRMHRFTVVVYVLGLAHALGSGTDASIPTVRYAMLASVLPVLFLFALRLQRSRSRGAASRPVAQRPLAPAEPAVATPAGERKAPAPPAGEIRVPDGHSNRLGLAPPRVRMQPTPSRGG